MNTRTLSRVAACAAALLLALLVGCPNPMAPPVKGGSLTVSIRNNINSLTLLPPISMDATSYTIIGAGPNGAAFARSTSGDPVTVDRLSPGTWTVTVNALNAGDTVIGQGQGTAAVTTEDNSTLAITVTPLSGTGCLNLSVTWTACLHSPSIQASLLPSSGSALDFTISGKQGTCSSPPMSAGYYTLTLQLLENGFPVMGAVEVVRIVAGQTTSGTYAFNDLNLGTLVVNITPALANPIPVSISGVPPTAAVGTSVTATASVSDGTANTVYAWYLNGVSQQATGPSYTFGSNLKAGHYRLDVTVFTANGTRAGSATADFQVVQGVPSIVGLWNWFRAFAKYTGVLEFRSDGTWISWEDYAGTIRGGGGTWSQTGDTLTLVKDGVPMGTFALQWVSANQVRISMSGLAAQGTLYRKGSEPDGYLFNNLKYPPIALARDTPAQGNLPSDGIVLYQYVAGPNAGNTTFSWTVSVQIWVYVNEETTVDPNNLRWRDSPHAIALTPGQAYYVVVANPPLGAGDFSIAATESPAYVGTWVNPAYNGYSGHGPPGKIVATATSATLYNNDTDTTPLGDPRPLIFENYWISDGAYYFQGRDRTQFVLLRVSNNNNTLEQNVSDTSYPTSIDPNGDHYCIWQRQLL